MRHYLNHLNCRAGVIDTAIAESEKQLGVKLPAEYIEFLKLTNGGEGSIGKQYMILWRVEELASINQGYEVQKCAPGLLLFGSDGGGEAYGFDARASQLPIVQVPFIGMNWNDARPVAESFGAFLAYL